MAGYGIAYPGVLDIHQPVFLAGLSNDLADGRVMDVRYFREKMMFYLEIQPSYQPGDDPVLGGEISRSLDLVDRPLVLHLACIYIGGGERSMLHGMRQLKYHAQHESRYTGEDDKADKPVLESYHVNGQAYKKEGME